MTAILTHVGTKWLRIPKKMEKTATTTNRSVHDAPLIFCKKKTTNQKAHMIKKAVFILVAKRITKGHSLAELF